MFLSGTTLYASGATQWQPTLTAHGENRTIQNLESAPLMSCAPELVDQHPQQIQIVASGLTPPARVA